MNTQMKTREVFLNLIFMTSFDSLYPFSDTKQAHSPLPACTRNNN